MGSRLLRLAAAASGALIVLLLAAGLLYWRGLRADPDAVVSEVVVSPAEVHLGDRVEISVEVTLPWHRRPTGEVDFVPPEGLQTLDRGQRKFLGLGLGSWRWQVGTGVQAYDFGPFKEMKAEVVLQPNRREQNARHEVDLPELTPTPRINSPEDADLALRGELAESFLDRQVNWLRIALIVVAAAALIGLLAWRFWPRREAYVPPPPKPWVVAEKAIAKLTEDLDAGLAAEAFFVRLTDIVRRYIEAIYRLPATEQTTPEFLYAIDTETSPLTTDQRLRLREFLSAADLVKFARADANREQIITTMQNAKQFVIETSEPLIHPNRVAPAPAETTS